jgi:hypothetical protein
MKLAYIKLNRLREMTTGPRTTDHGLGTKMEDSRRNVSQLVKPGSLSVMAATIPAMSAYIIQIGHSSAILK